MKVIVLGNTGMLGRYVSKYLKDKKFKVINISRDQCDAHRFDDFTFRNFKFNEGDVFINCMGIIPQRNQVNNGVFISVNSAFPHLIFEYCKKNKFKFIHITTDCVFSGKDGDYNEGSIHDEKDIYGKSKSLGEPDEATIVRASIIGEELFNKKSLLEWVKSNRNKTINGYINHYWNGITCLQFAKICEQIINNNMYWEDVKHVYSPRWINKFELVKMISEVYDLNITVEPFETTEKCDKTLNSIRIDVEDIEVPSLRTQLEELANFELEGD